MKVSDLIDRLQDFPEDSDVGFAYNYGDIWRTVVVSKITEVDELEVKYSDYHSMLRLTDGEESDNESEMMVVLQ
jgi:hypothetical protein